MKSLEYLAGKYEINYMALLMRVRRQNLKVFRYKKKIFLTEEQELLTCHQLYKRRKNIMVLFKEKKYIILPSKMNN
jgi:hypothetical protein